LDEFESKREILAKAFKRNDETLTGEELTEATQKTIDRLVFIRFLEDKLIEQHHNSDSNFFFVRKLARFYCRNHFKFDSGFV
jgi:hypothetical protein